MNNNVKVATYPESAARNAGQTRRELFNKCRGDVPLEVMNVCGSAADNAAATINENGSKFVQGHFTDEFIGYWFDTVQGILCESDCPAEAREWFEAAGVRY